MQKQEFLSRWLEIIKRSSAVLVYKQDFVNRLLDAIRKSATRHTYDLAWLRALVEAAGEAAGEAAAGPDRGETEIRLQSTAEKMVKYYWDQTVFFGLVQGVNPCRQPDLICRVRELIDEYYKGRRSGEPVSFINTNFNPRLKAMAEEHVRTAVEILKKDVVTRFLGKGRLNQQYIKYSGGEESLALPQNTLSAIKENSPLIIEAIYYRWAQVLEKYNTSPRLNKKVRIIDNACLRERPLSFYAKYLDLENPGHLCFFCGQAVEDKDLSIGHVIPWSYLCSDDIWNLVYLHKECQSEKAGAVPPEFSIARLEKRNRALLEKLSSCTATDMVAGSLQDAVTRNLVRKNWICCR